MTDFLIQVVIDPQPGVRGSKKIGDELGKLEDRADSLGESLNRAFKLVGTGLVLRELQQLTDAYTNAQNRIRTVVSSEEELAATTEQLFQISNRTRSSYEATAETYARVALATREMGISQQETLAFTESLNQAIILSGASSQEAEQGLIQLAQGMASGALRGDELRSVLEQLPAVADVIAKGLGVTRGQLRALGEQGRLTTEVIIGAFAEARDELEGKFGKTVPTLGQSFQVLKNNVLQFVGETDKATGTTAALSKGVIFLSENIGYLATGVGIVALAVGGQYVASAVAGIAATGGLTVSVAALNATIAANPIAAWSIALGVVTAEMVAFGVEIIKVQEEISKIEGSGNKLELTEFGKLGDDILRVKALLAQAERTFDSTGGATSAAGQKVEQYRAKLKQLTDQQELLRTGQARTTIEAKEQQKALEALSASVDDVVKGIERENGLLALNSRERTIQTELLRQIDELNKASGPDVTDAQRAQLEAVIRSNQEAKEQAALLEQLRGPQQEFEQRVQTATAALKAGVITAEEYQKALNKAHEAMGNGGPQGPVAPEQPQPPGFDIPDGPLPLDEILKDIERENGLLTLGNAEREHQARLLDLLDQIRAGGQTITQREIDLLDQKLRVGERLREEEALAAEAEQNRIRLAQERIAAEQQVLDNLRGPQEQLNQLTRAANDLFAAGAISASEYARSIDEITVASLQASTTFEDGINRGLAKTRLQLEDLASVGEQLVVNGFGEATDALVNFARTGELSFDGLVNSILDDLTRLAAQQLMSSLLGGLFGGAGGAGGLLGGLFGGARAGGGDVDSDKSYLVGEQGPELFTPEHAGNITPAGETAAMLGNQVAPTINVSAPPAMVQVVNVRDEDEIPRAISSPAGEQAVLKVMNKNTATTRRM